MSRPRGVTETKRRNVDPVKARERAEAAARASHTPDTLISRIERAKERLTPAQWDRLAALLASAPSVTNGGTDA